MMRNKDIELEVGEVKREWMVATFSTIEELRGGRGGVALPHPWMGSCGGKIQRRIQRYQTCG
jgi:hypothetical protein